MDPRFDSLKKAVFSQIIDVMGEDAVWSSSKGDADGRILFNYPTKPLPIGQSDVYEYEPVTPKAEFYKETFVGLKEATDQQSEEFLIIRGAKYLVTKVVTKFDGDTCIAELELVDN